MFTNNFKKLIMSFEEKDKISVSGFFSEFLKLIRCYDDVIVIHSKLFGDGRISFQCHIINPARIVDLLYICSDINTRSNVYSNSYSIEGESTEDSFKKLIWGFFFSPGNNYKKLDGEIMPIKLFYFYSLVLRDLKKKNLINEQEFAYFENYQAKFALALDS